jgi:hypothetical protein
MSGKNDRKQAIRGDLVICLDTGSVGVILERHDNSIYLVSFPHGTYLYEREDFDILKSGVPFNA